jgi:hypothetical protein
MATHPQADIMQYIKRLAFLILLALPAILRGQDDSWLVYDDGSLARIDITIQPEYLDWMYAHADSDSEHFARFHFQNQYIDERVDSIGFRLRGGTSRESAKKSFKVSFNTFVRGRQFHGLDKLNLNGEHNDPSIIRSKLCFDLYQDIGHVAARANHVRLYINGRYYGLFISVEHIDDEFLAKRFADDSGNLWKCLYPADLVYKGDSPLAYKNLYNNGRPAYELTTNEAAGDYGPLARLIRILNRTPAAALPDSLESFLDVPGVLQYFAMNVLLGSWDDYRSLMNNYYLYYEPSISRFTLIPYDYDNTFGVDWSGTDWSLADPYNFPKVAGGSRPLAERLLALDPYRDLFTHFLEFYSSEVFELNHWEARIDRLKGMITEAALADSFRTLDYGFTAADFTNSYTTGEYRNKHVKFGLKQYITRRAASLPAQLRYTRAAPRVYRIAIDPPHPSPGDSIRVDAACFAAAGLEQVTLLYTLDGSASATEYGMQRRRISGTKKVEEYDRWSATLPPLPPGARGSLRILVCDSLSQQQVFPLGKAILLKTPGEAAGGVVLNELMAANSHTFPDPAGEYDDWIELYNAGEAALPLGGLYLSDKRDRLTKWRFARTDLILPPGASLIVWCDEQQEQGDLHTNFKLSADGEFIALVDRDGVTILDSLGFGPQQTDLSLGRYPDGSGEWQTMPPSPGQVNRTANRVWQSETAPQLSLQAWPNPFNAAARIQFSLTHSGRVTLALYNITGQQVRSLLSERMASGRHSLTVHADDLPSGIFFCLLQTNDSHQMLKLVVVK